MEIYKLGKHSSVHKATRSKVEAQAREHFDMSYGDFEIFRLKKGDRIVILGRWEYEVEDIIFLDSDSVARALNFGKGLTCDQYIVLDDGTDELVVICDEPYQIQEEDYDDEYGYVIDWNKLADATHVLTHN